MTSVLTREEMQQADRIAIEEVGIPSLVLMEVAGRAVADAAEECASGRPVLALAGTGNNGGDAVVAARHLRERDVDVTLVVLGTEDKLSDDCRAQLQMADRLGLTAEYLSGRPATLELPSLLARHPVVIDGMFGTGLGRAIEGWRREVIEIVRGSEAQVVAVDLPSGIDANTGAVQGAAFFAEVTVTFQFPKLGQLLFPGRAHCGALRVADIGIPPSRVREMGPLCELLTDDLIGQACPPRAADTHKGTYGHLLVVAGTPDRPGSSLLAGRAALRTGAGLVTIASSDAAVARIAPVLDELMGLSLGDRIEVAPILEALERRTALAIGPSLDLTADFVRALLEGAQVPAVVDAGAVTPLGSDLGWMKARSFPTVLTPHPGEMARLIDGDSHAVQQDRIGVARAVAERSGAFVVLKGASTVVVSPDGRVGITTRGNAGMASGGMGDALTGVIGALLAQGVEPELAARTGVQLHGAAGDRAAAKVGEPSLVASDLIRSLPEVLS